MQPGRMIDTIVDKPRQWRIADPRIPPCASLTMVIRLNPVSSLEANPQSSELRTQNKHARQTLFQCLQTGRGPDFVS